MNQAGSWQATPTDSTKTERDNVWQVGRTRRLLRVISTLLRSLWGFRPPPDRPATEAQLEIKASAGGWADSGRLGLLDPERTWAGLWLLCNLVDWSMKTRYPAAWEHVGNHCTSYKKPVGWFYLHCSVSGFKESFIYSVYKQTAAFLIYWNGPIFTISTRFRKRILRQPLCLCWTENTENLF